MLPTLSTARVTVTSPKVRSVLVVVLVIFCFRFGRNGPYFKNRGSVDCVSLIGTVSEEAMETMSVSATSKIGRDTHRRRLNQSPRRRGT